MIRVEGFENEYVLDLNEVNGSEHELLVISKDKEGFKHVQWGIDMKSSDAFTAEIIGKNALLVSADTNSICGEEYFWIRNVNGDKFKVVILPSEKVVTDREFVFSANWLRRQDKLYIDLISTVNGEPCEWSCTYDAFPLKMDIYPKSGNGDTVILVETKSFTNDDVKSLIEFTQDESENTVKMRFIINGGKITTIE